MSAKKLLARIVIALIGLQVAGFVAALLAKRRYLAQDYGEGSVNEVAVFGGAEKEVMSQPFTGGAVRAICGGVELDLTGAEIADAPAILDVTVICGGVMVKAPLEWRVALTPSVTMSGVEDMREQSDPSTESPPDLIITGKIICGGLAVGDAEMNLHELHATE